jgi:osmotically-inducible protein OsmY
MEKNRIKRVPVMRGNELVGIVSRANLVRALASLARAAPLGEGDDQAVRERVLAQLDGLPWRPVDINVVVRKGEVDVSGVIIDERQRQALRVAVENALGVKAVHDHVACVDPVSGLVFFSPEDEARGTVRQ